MKQQIMKTLLAAMLVSGAGAWAAPVYILQAQDRQTEKQLSDQIEDRFEQDATLKNHNLRASVDGRVATLTGTVETEAQRDRAGRLARVAGVSGVENHIVLGPVHKGVAQKTEEKVKKGVEKGVSATEKGVQKAGEALTKTGSEITDAAILSTVKARFTDEDLLKGSDINVDCDKQVVTLKGTVASQAGRDRAVELARSAKGVERVVDRLVIKP
jgi:hyperosmotically inducible periplasmic protein